MKRHIRVSLAAIASMAGGAAPEPSAVTRPMERALQVAGSDQRPLYDLLCPATGTAPPTLTPSDPTSWYAPPGKAFDDLVFVGQKSVAAWALKTSEGVILIDSLYGYSVEREIVEGLRSVGIDPATIKYVVVTHAHADHYGGAHFLQQHYGARVVMSKEDWDNVASETRWTDPKPDRDISVDGHMALTLGKTSIDLYLTPGHTTGTLSVLFPVHDHGRTHLVALWGGTAFIKKTPETYVTMAESARRFAATAKARGADVWMSNHPAFDGAFAKLALNADGTSPSAFVTGSASIQRALRVVELCSDAALARYRLLHKG